MEKKNTDKELLLRILSKEEFEILENAYIFYHTLQNDDYKKMLLRRIDDVISMARYIDLTYPNFSQTDYDVLGARMTNLKIAVRHLQKEPENDLSFNYMADQHDCPLILSSIQFMDYERFHEIDELLDDISSKNEKEVTLSKELKAMVGKKHHVLYTRNNSQVMVYDVYSNVHPIKDKSALLGIRNLCMDELKVGTDVTLQTIYDDMVFSTLHFNLPLEKKGYRFIKKEKGYSR